VTRIAEEVLDSAVSCPDAAGRQKCRLHALPLAQALAEFERTYIERMLRMSGGNIARAARVAGVDRSNFRRLLKRHGIEGMNSLVSEAVRSRPRSQ
jgi:DNA-binding NtrC family response regulator